MGFRNKGIAPLCMKELARAGQAMGIRHETIGNAIVTSPIDSLSQSLEMTPSGMTDYFATTDHVLSRIENRKGWADPNG